MIVAKFGGSSLANAEKIRNVAGIIKSLLDKKPIIVVSALGSTTDDLLAAGQNALKGIVELSKVKDIHFNVTQELKIDFSNIIFDELEELLTGISLIKELSPRTSDYLVSFGERLAVRILSSYLSKIGISSKYFDAWQLGIFSTSDFTNADVLEESYANIRANLAHLNEKYSYTPIITGYIAKDKNGNVTTLGRGGSDLTASVIGAALQAEEIQVWKDVDGILTTDPRLVKDAHSLNHVSFEEASELAYFGAKVLHPRSILPAMKMNIPVRVKNSYNPSHQGTLILSSLLEDGTLVRAITFKRNVTLVDIISTRMLGQYGFLASVFRLFADAKISVDMVATSEVSISLTLDNGMDRMQLKELENIASVNIKKNKAIISLIGNVHHSSEILDKAFSVLNRNRINVQMLSQGASKVNISFIVDDDEADICVKELHKLFFEEGKLST